MSALARYFKAKKWVVSGSDLLSSPITDSLQKEAINVKIGHIPGNIPSNTSLVVYNRAIPESNLELRQAEKLGLKILPYAEVLGELTRKHLTIAITGSHGKSTTTALTGLVCMKGGIDPTILPAVELAAPCIPCPIFFVDSRACCA